MGHLEGLSFGPDQVSWVNAMSSVSGVPRTSLSSQRWDPGTEGSSQSLAVQATLEHPGRIPKVKQHACEFRILWCDEGSFFLVLQLHRSLPVLIGQVNGEEEEGRFKGSQCLFRRIVGCILKYNVVEFPIVHTETKKKDGKTIRTMGAAQGP